MEGEGREPLRSRSMNLTIAAGAAPTDWGIFWAYAGVVVVALAAVGGVTIGYVKVRLNSQEITIDGLRKDMKRQGRKLHKDLMKLTPTGSRSRSDELSTEAASAELIPRPSRSADPIESGSRRG